MPPAAACKDAPAEMRVTLKNTFLSFEGAEDEDDDQTEEMEQPRRRSMTRESAASPRSRSMECPSPTRDRVDSDVLDQQIQNLNRIITPAVSPSGAASPCPGASSGRGGAASPIGRSSPGPGRSSPNSRHLPGVGPLPSLPDFGGNSVPPVAGVGPGHQSQANLGPGAASSGHGHGGAGGAGVAAAPSTEELWQLRRRLEEMCQLKGGTAGSEPAMSRVLSNGSVASMALSAQDFENEEGCVEFDINIEEEEPHQAPKPPLAVRNEVPQAEQVIPAPPGARHEKVDRRPFVPANRKGSDPNDKMNLGAPRAPSPPNEAVSPRTVSPLAALRSAGALVGQGRGPLQEGNNRPPPATGRGLQCRPQPNEYRHGHVPRTLNLKDEFAARQQSEEAPKNFTTLMIRNIPNRYSQRELIMELEDLGFAGAFDFLYVPLDKGTMLNVGYAFVNFVNTSWAEQCIKVFRNYRFRRHRKLSSKIASVSVAHIQGLEANLAHYEKAAVSASKLKQQRPVLMANISTALTSLIDDDATAT